MSLDQIFGSAPNLGLENIIAGAFSFILIFVLAMYVFGALALMAIANKTKTDNAWLAWIPIANFYLITQMAGQSGWWTLALLGIFIPFFGSLAVIGISIWFFWIIAERINMPGWTSILLLIPIVNFAIIGIYAWSK